MRNEWRNENNEMISMHNLDPERQRQALIPLEQLSNAMVVEDTAALLAFIGGGEPVRPGGVGSIGYCMGGRHVLCVAGAFPDRFIAGASLHGTALVTDRDGFAASPGASLARRTLLRLRGDTIRTRRRR